MTAGLEVMHSPSRPTGCTPVHKAERTSTAASRPSRRQSPTTISSFVGVESTGLGCQCSIPVFSPSSRGPAQLPQPSSPPSGLLRLHLPSCDTWAAQDVQVTATQMRQSGAFEAWEWEGFPSREKKGSRHMGVVSIFAVAQKVMFGSICFCTGKRRSGILILLWSLREKSTL